MTPKQFNRQTQTIENFPYKTDSLLNPAIRVGRTEILIEQHEKLAAELRGQMGEPVGRSGCAHNFTDSDRCDKCGLTIPF